MGADLLGGERAGSAGERDDAQEVGAAGAVHLAKQRGFAGQIFVGDAGRGVHEDGEGDFVVAGFKDGFGESEDNGDGHAGFEEQRGVAKLTAPFPGQPAEGQREQEECPEAFEDHAALPKPDFTLADFTTWMRELAKLP